MGLPIWRDPDEQSSTGNVAKSDPTASARSSIRRQARVRRSHPRPPPRDPSMLIAHITRSPSPPRGSRRGTVRGVPPISTLLESADRADAPPPPAPESRSYYEASELRRRQYGTNSPGFGDDLVRLQRQIHGAARAFEREDTSRRHHLHRTGQTELHIDDEGHVRIRHGQRSARRRSVSPYRGSLPTPPMDVSREENSLRPDETEPPPRRSSPTHPLRNSWSPEPGMGGLGDRNWSPTPGDGWEIIRATITPDATLPSADSSFTSAAVGHSFAPNSGPSAADAAWRTESTADAEDYLCYDEDIEATEAFAEDIYFHEMSSYEGRRRIAHHQEIRAREGNRFALADEPERTDLGFRLIEDALESPEGRNRLTRIGLLNSSQDLQRIRDVAQMRRNAETRTSHRRARGPEDGPPPPQPNRYSETHQRAIRESRGHVHDYFRRFTAGSLIMRPQSSSVLHDQEARTAPVESQVRSVSPAGPQTDREAADAIVSGDEMDPMVVERLARQENVPDEWWSSMGLNLSRTRPDSARRSPRREQRTAPQHASARDSRL